MKSKVFRYSLLISEFPGWAHIKKIFLWEGIDGAKHKFLIILAGGEGAKKKIKFRFLQNEGKSKKIPRPVLKSPKSRKVWWMSLSCGYVCFGFKDYLRHHLLGQTIRGREGRKKLIFYSEPGGRKDEKNKSSSFFE